MNHVEDVDSGMANVLLFKKKVLGDYNEIVIQVVWKNTQLLFSLI